jgi:arylsulfatase A-like enzyme
MWMAGAGIKKGHIYGISDDFGFNIAENPVHVHDIQATILHQLGIDHEALTYRFQGRQYRLTDVHGQVVKEILA